MNSPLRNRLSARRNAIAGHERKAKQLQINTSLIQLITKQGYNRVAVYLAIGSEVSLALFISWLHGQNKDVYLPVIDMPDSGNMQFIKYDSQTQLTTRKFGLNEPVNTSDIIAPQKLDFVCIPMLGYNKNTRIGWGKGYYDRCFSFRKATSSPPLLAGIAFSEQYDPDILAQKWDVPFDMLVTDSTKGTLKC